MWNCAQSAAAGIGCDAGMVPLAPLGRRESRLQAVDYDRCRASSIGLDPAEGPCSGARALVPSAECLGLGSGCHALSAEYRFLFPAVFGAGWQVPCVECRVPGAMR